MSMDVAAREEGSVGTAMVDYRFVAAAAALVALAAHLPITGPHLREAPYVGVLFLALEAACLLLAVGLVAHPRPWLWRSAELVGALAVAAYLLSRAFGLPQMAEDRGDWTNPLGVIAVTAESTLVLVAVRARRRRVVGPASTRLVPLLVGVLALAVGMGSTAWAATSQRIAVDSRPRGTPGMTMGTMTGQEYWSKVAGRPFAATGTTRTYYISAEEVAWNYAPSGRNQITGKPFDDVADVFVRSGPGRIGSVYRKCLYRGYTDAGFQHRTRVAARDRYLGLLGPVIRAEVGDRIKVVFRNRCSFPTSVHPHGVFYAKNSEGAPYADATKRRDKTDDLVPTGGRHTYLWKVPERAGPGPAEGSSVMWMYHSHGNEVADTNAGLVGPMVVTRRGIARADGSPVDVDREVFELFSVLDENQSPYLDGNEEEYAQGKHSEDDEEGFEESNLMHSVNGYVYGNQPVLSLRRGERVRWYVMGMGTEVDLHTPHWHGNDVTVNGMRMDVVNLLPAAMVVADMVPDNSGTWLFHCHVNDHIVAGMTTRYRVVS
jgi:manganese oxidase